MDKVLLYYSVRSGLMYMLLSFFMIIANSSNNRDVNYYIARFLIENYLKIDQLTIQEIAEECFVSIPTIKKFFTQFGLNTYVEVKKKIRSERLIRKNQIEINYNKVNKENLIKGIFEISAENNIDTFLHEKEINNIVSDIRKSNRIIIYGSTSFTQLLFSFQMDMITMGKTVFISSLVDHNLLDTKKNDLVILISGSGRLFDSSLKMTSIFQQLDNPIYVFSGDVIPHYSFDINGKILLNVENEMFDTEYVVLFYFDLIKLKYYDNYVKEQRNDN